MDINTINGVIRAIVPAALAWLAAKGYLTQGQIADLTAAAVTIVAAVWSIYSNRK